MRAFLLLLHAASVTSCATPAAPPSVVAEVAAPRTVAPAPAAAVSDDPLVGRLRFDGGAGERALVVERIEAATAEMSFIVRGIARGRLEETNRAPDAIELSRQGDVMTVVIDGRRYAAPFDGAPVTVTGVGGDEVALTYRRDGDRLVQTFRGEDGGRENVFRFVDAETVVLEVRVFSERLPADLRYSLTYRRQSPLPRPP